MKELRSDFEFKDSRDYIHSTTMIEFICEQLNETNPVSKVQEIKFQDFVRANGSWWIAESRKDLVARGEKPKIEARVEQQDGQIVHLNFVEDLQRPVIRRIKTHYLVELDTLSQPFSGKARIGAQNRIAYVENLVEANKRIHQVTLQNAPGLKVINYCMKNFRIPQVADYGESLNIEIENLSHRTQGESVSTLSRVHFEREDFSPFEFYYVVHGVSSELRD